MCELLWEQILATCPVFVLQYCCLFCEPFNYYICLLIYDLSDSLSASMCVHGYMHTPPLEKLGKVSSLFSSIFFLPGIKLWSPGLGMLPSLGQVPFPIELFFQPPTSRSWWSKTCSSRLILNYRDTIMGCMMEIILQTTVNQDLIVAFFFSHTHESAAEISLLQDWLLPSAELN